MSFNYEAFDWTTLPKFTSVFASSSAFITAVGTTTPTLSSGILTYVWFVLSSEFPDSYLMYETTALASRHLVNTTISQMPHFQKKYLYWLETLNPATSNKTEFLRLYQSGNDITRTGAKESELRKSGTEGKVATVDTTRTNDITDTNTSKVARTPTDVVASTDFVDDYTNEQWKSAGTTGSDGTENIDTTHTVTRNLADNLNETNTVTESKDYDKQGNLSNLFGVFNEIPRSLYDEICNIYVKHFLPIFGLGDVPTV